MGEWIGRGRKARRSYGFDEIALVPGTLTMNPDEVDISFKIGDQTFEVPVIAAAMDGVVDVKFACEMGRMGGLAMLNLEGVQTRFEDPSEVLNDIANSTPEKATELLQKLYQPEIKEELIARRIEEIKAGGGSCIVSAIPQRAERFGAIAQEAGADVFCVQATVVTVRHQSSAYKMLNIADLCKKMTIPIVVGNVVTPEVCLELMEAGVDALLIGVGPGAACTTRGVLGVGIPQVTATVDAAWARDKHLTRTGKYVSIITDGGMSAGGDICKALACGADAVMVGSAFARSNEAPGGGYHWGMATPHHNLPRGTRIKVGVTGSLEEILIGPAHLDDGSQNLVGAIKTCMGYMGASTIREFQETEIVIAPAIKTEGKLFQKAQNLGMAKN